MKKTLIAAALSTAFTLPALAHEWPADDDGRKPEFTFELDIGAILAQADEARTNAQAAADRARAAADKAREAAAHGRDMESWARDFSAEMATSMAYMFSDRTGRGRVVKGQPYSADVVTETNQALPDGNVISHRNVNKVWRDSEGRTRQETYRSDKLRSIYISDPVGAVAYTVIPGSKLAIAIPRMEFTHETRAPRARVDKERVETDKSGKTTTTETSSDGRRVVVRTVDRDGVPGVREEVRVQVVRVGDDANVVVVPPVPPVAPVPPAPPGAHAHPVPPVPPIAPMAMIPGVHTMRFESTAHLGKGETKSLGTKDFEGVKAEGKQTTWTIPAGQIGNRNPINVTSESWYSPDLQVTVYSRHNDPRTGESLYRLAAIKRAEPQADLFKVPEGYEVKGRKKDSKEKDKEKR